MEEEKKSMSITCNHCNIVMSSLATLLKHVQGGCDPQNNTKQGQDVPKKPAKTPAKTKTVPKKRTSSAAKSKPNDVVTVVSGTHGRATRYRTGAIKPKSALELLGIKKEEVDDYEEESRPTKRKRVSEPDYCAPVLKVSSSTKMSEESSTSNIIIIKPVEKPKNVSISKGKTQKDDLKYAQGAESESARAKQDVVQQFKTSALDNKPDHPNMIAEATDVSSVAGESSREVEQKSTEIERATTGFLLVNLSSETGTEVMEISCNTELNENISAGRREKLCAETEVDIDQNSYAETEVNTDQLSPAETEVNTDQTSCAETKENTDLISPAETEVNTDQASCAEPEVNTDQDGPVENITSQNDETEYEEITVKLENFKSPDIEFIEVTPVEGGYSGHTAAETKKAGSATEQDQLKLQWDIPDEEFEKTPNGFICTKCSSKSYLYIFKTRLEFKIHRHCHIEDEPHNFYCRESNCCFTTNIWSNMRDHIFTHDSLKLLLEDTEMYAEYLQQENNPAPTSNDIAPKTTKSRQTVERAYQCKICKRRFKSRFGAEFHIQFHIDENNSQFICQSDECKIQMEDWSEFLIHLVSHEEYRKKIDGSEFFKELLSICSGNRPPKNRTSDSFKCRFCSHRYFITELELHAHEDTHVTVGTNGPHNKFKCKECEYTVNDWGRLWAHIFKHDYYKKLLADTFLYKSQFGAFTCCLCSKTFDRKYNLISHFSRVHFKQDRICEVCGDTKSNMDDKTFKLHVERCRNVVHVCEECGYESKVLSLMNQHKKIHIGTGFTCQTCGKSFPTAHRLKVHAVRHLDDTERVKFSCDICNNLFKTRDAVIKHKTRMHFGKNQIFNCTICKFTCKMEGDLKKHFANMHNKKYKCCVEGCNYNTNKEKEMEEHGLFHIPGKCSLCPMDGCYYAAYTPEEVYIHMQEVHKVNSKYRCPVCSKFFAKKTPLLRHIVTHTKDKPYQCHTCGAAFMSHSSYYTHRNKTGHDAKREGVLSVPQNITIRYVEEAEENQETSLVAVQQDDIGPVVMIPESSRTDNENINMIDVASATRQILSTELGNVSLENITDESFTLLQSDIKGEPQTQEVHVLNTGEPLIQANQQIKTEAKHIINDPSGNQITYLLEFPNGDYDNSQIYQVPAAEDGQQIIEETNVNNDSLEIPVSITSSNETPHGYITAPENPIQHTFLDSNEVQQNEAQQSYNTTSNEVPQNQVQTFMTTSNEVQQIVTDGQQTYITTSNDGQQSYIATSNDGTQNLMEHLVVEEGSEVVLEGCEGTEGQQLLIQTEDGGYQTVVVLPPEVGGEGSHTDAAISMLQLQSSAQ